MEYWYTTAMLLKKVLLISRPRFWLYLAGPYLIGLAAAAQSTADLTGFWVWSFLLYFLLPANLFVYGINDIYDYETDKLNPKKSHYETLVTPDMQARLANWILISNVPFWILAFGFPLRHILAMLGFILFGMFYSATPIRAKTKPLLDSVFNILYLFPGWFSFYLAGGHGFNWHIFLAGTLWVMAMHAFSAIPDIQADTRAGLRTIATYLGLTGTLIFCALCYAGAALLAAPYLHSLALILGSLYVLMITIAFLGKTKTWVFQTYTWFPFVNAILGFSIFVYIALDKIKVIGY